MFNTRPPSQLVLKGSTNHAETWRQWYTEFAEFLRASGGDKGGSDVKTGLLLELIGPKGYNIYSSFIFDEDEDRKDFNKLVKKFNDHFVSKQNIVAAVPRHKFFTRNQEKGESIDDYAKALRALAEECQFDHLEEGLIRDRIVCGIRKEETRKILLETEDLSLEKVVEICREIENPNSKNGVDGSSRKTEPSGSGRGYRRRLATSIRFTNWSSTC